MARKKVRQFTKLPPKEKQANRSFLRYAAESIFGALPSMMATSPVDPPAPEPVKPLQHEEIMRSLFVQSNDKTALVHGLFKDESVEEIVALNAVAHLQSIAPQYVLLVESAPSLYRMLSRVSDALRLIEEYAQSTGNEPLERCAHHQAEGCNAAMMVATHGVKAASKAVEQELKSNRL